MKNIITHRCGWFDAYFIAALAVQLKPGNKKEDNEFPRCLPPIVYFLINKEILYLA